MWERRILKELIKIEIDSEEVDPLKDYDFAGLSGFGRGLFKKGIISGANTTYKKFNKLHSRSLVLSKVKGWEGAIAIVSDDFEGLYLSPQYPTFKPIGDEVDIQFIAYYFKQAKTWAEIFNLSKGIGARRNSVSEKQFLEIEIDVPPINIQRTIIEKLDFIQNKIVEIKKLIVQQKKDIEDLLYSKFSDLVKGVSYRKMAKTAPIIRRPVVIELDGEYPELGVRGFGRGIFHKPTLIGADLDWQ
ncbi:MAG: restriction endonuclease subunit S, partial [Bacteroidota bacterium]